MTENQLSLEDLVYSVADADLMLSPSRIDLTGCEDVLISCVVVTPEHADRIIRYIAAIRNSNNSNGYGLLSERDREHPNLADWPEQLLSRLIHLPGGSAYVDQVCKSLTGWTTPWITSSTVARDLLNTELFTPAHLGTLHRFLQVWDSTRKPGVLTEATQFAEQLCWWVEQTPFRIQLDALATYTHAHRVTDTFEVAGFDQKVRKHLPELVGFPDEMQLRMAVKLRDRVPVPDEWNVDVFPG